MYDLKQSDCYRMDNLTHKSTESIINSYQLITFNDQN